MDLTKAEDIKKRQQGHTDELYKKDVNDPDNHDGVSTHIKSDNLEYEDKWTFGSITTNKPSGRTSFRSYRIQAHSDATFRPWHSTIPTRCIPLPFYIRRIRWRSH